MVVFVFACMLFGGYFTLVQLLPGWCLIIVLYWFVCCFVVFVGCSVVGLVLVLWLFGCCLVVVFVIDW